MSRKDGDLSSTSSETELPDPGVGLCLSGGGYRAALFHLGTLWRLNEFGYLKLIDRISSVSGGTIVSAWLGSVWNKLNFDENGVARNFEDEVVNPLRNFTATNLDVYIILMELVNPFRSIGELLIGAYRKHLFADATLQDLPHRPWFVFNASNAQSGALWRFSRPYAWDYLVGEIENPTTELSVVVAASSAFPPFMSPVRLKLQHTDYTPNTGSSLQREPFTTNVVLMDGGVYDNLGLEPILKRYETILVSDAGGRMQPEESPRLFWGLQAFRVLNMIDNQVRSLRKRDIIEMYVLRKKLLDAGLQPQDDAIRIATRKGSYWSTFSDISDYATTDTLECPHEKTIKLAQLPTRLWALSKEKQERLVNWGYAICDAAMRKYVDPELPANAEFPYVGGVG